jgi:hypothetical protein
LRHQTPERRPTLTGFRYWPLKPCVRFADLLQRISVHPIRLIS